MRTDFTSAQRLALRALADGALERIDGDWIVAGPDQSQVLTAAMVRWLVGEAHVEKTVGSRPDRPRYRLTERGRRAVVEAMSVEAALWRATSPADALAGMPVLLVPPAMDSEELDWLLVVPMAAADRERHLRRLEALDLSLGEAPERFEFVQYADDVYAIPIGPRIADAGLLPQAGGDVQVLADGLPGLDELGARRCTDRGVNYGRTWVQWFGGFDRESPLIVSVRVSRRELLDAVAAPRRAAPSAGDG